MVAISLVIIAHILLIPLACFTFEVISDLQDEVVVIAESGVLFALHRVYRQCELKLFCFLQLSAQ